MNFLVSSSEGKPITSQGIPLVCNTNSYFGLINCKIYIECG